uniref:Uncharacterized protein n=1 Tax=Oryza brachyantha TaxID=4533 RepID=J3N1T2_ORYBR
MRSSSESSPVLSQPLVTTRPPESLPVSARPPKSSPVNARSLESPPVDDDKEEAKWRLKMATTAATVNGGNAGEEDGGEEGVRILPGYDDGKGADGGVGPKTSGPWVPVKPVSTEDIYSTRFATKNKQAMKRENYGTSQAKGLFALSLPTCKFSMAWHN